MVPGDTGRGSAAGGPGNLQVSIHSGAELCCVVAVAGCKCAQVAAGTAQQLRLAPKRWPWFRTAHTAACLTD